MKKFVFPSLLALFLIVYGYVGAYVFGNSDGFLIMVVGTLISIFIVMEMAENIRDKK